MRLIKLIALTITASMTLALGSCAAKHITITQEIKQLEANEARDKDILETCYDDQGNFDENMGHDTLDCGNL